MDKKVGDYIAKPSPLKKAAGKIRKLILITLLDIEDGLGKLHGHIKTYSLKDAVEKKVVRLMKLTNETYEECYREKERGKKAKSDGSDTWAMQHQLRKGLSHKYIKKGSGIEIGATYLPLEVIADVKVTYVDIMSKENLLKTDPNLKGKEVTHVDVLDDAEKLIKFGNNSQDFIIANHLVEHVMNPIQAIASFLRVLKTEGIIFMAVPEMRVTFDKHRPLTPISHLIEVFEKKEDDQWFEHYIECAIFLGKKPKNKAKKTAKELIDSKLSIHYHTFQPRSFLSIIDYMRRLGYPIEICEIVEQSEGTNEFIVVMKKLSVIKTIIKKLIGPLYHKPS